MDGNLTWQQGNDEIDAFFDVDGYIADGNPTKSADATVAVNGGAEGIVANGEVVRHAEEITTATDELRCGSSAALTTKKEVETDPSVGEEAKSGGDAVSDAPDGRPETRDPDTSTTEQTPTASGGHSGDQPADNGRGPGHTLSQAPNDGAAGTTHPDQPHYIQAADDLPAHRSFDVPPSTRRRNNSMDIAFIVNEESAQPEAEQAVDTTEQSKTDQDTSDTNAAERGTTSPRAGPAVVEAAKSSSQRSPAAATPPPLGASAMPWPPSAESSAAPEAYPSGSDSVQAELGKTDEDDAMATKASGVDDTGTWTLEQAAKADSATSNSPLPMKLPSSPKAVHTLPDRKDSAAAEQLPRQSPLQTRATPQRAQDEIQQPSSGDKSSLIEEMRQEDEDAEVGPNLSRRDGSVAVKLMERLSEAAAEGGREEDLDVFAGVAGGEAGRDAAVMDRKEVTMADDTTAVEHANGPTGDGNAGGELDASIDAEGHASTGPQKNPEKPDTYDADVKEQDAHTLARAASSEDELASTSPRTMPRKRKAAPMATTRPARKKAKKAAPVDEDAVPTQKSKATAGRYSVGVRELKDLAASETKTLPAETQKSKGHYIPARELKDLGVAGAETLLSRGARRGREG